MIFFFDNNLPPALARAIDCLLRSVEPEHSACHLIDRFEPHTTDLQWIEALSTEPGTVIITQDALYRDKLQKAALRASDLVVFALSKGWASQRFWLKAAQLVRWFPRIIDQANLIRGGAVFSVPWNVSGDGKFEQVKL